MWIHRLYYADKGHISTQVYVKWKSQEERV